MGSFSRTGVTAKELTCDSATANCPFVIKANLLEATDLRGPLSICMQRFNRSGYIAAPTIGGAYQFLVLDPMPLSDQEALGRRIPQTCCRVQEVSR